MKKLAFAIALVSLVAQGLGVWYLYRHRHRPQRPHFQLQAMMRDEDAPRPIVPSVGLQVNDALRRHGRGRHARRVHGRPRTTPRLTTSSPPPRSSPHPLQGMRANAPGRAQLQADYQARSAPAKIVLGDAAHPWTGAVQLLLAGTA